MEERVNCYKSPFRVKITITFDQVVLAWNKEDADNVAWEKIFNEELATIEVIRGGQ
mgnify:CR=1 FL=1